MTFYILDDDHKPVRLSGDIGQQALRFEAFLRDIAKRVVAQDTLEDLNLWVSTVFLGLDYNFSRTGPPLLFETMVFIDKDGGGEFAYRYPTWKAAKAGHETVLAIFRGEAKPGEVPEAFRELFTVRARCLDLSQTLGAALKGELQAPEAAEDQEPELDEAEVVAALLRGAGIDPNGGEK